MLDWLWAGLFQLAINFLKFYHEDHDVVIKTISTGPDRFLFYQHLLQSKYEYIFFNRFEVCTSEGHPDLLSKQELWLQESSLSNLPRHRMSFYRGEFQLSRGDDHLCQVSSEWLLILGRRSFNVWRAKPKSNVDAKEDWSSVFGFGVMSREKQVLDEVKNTNNKMSSHYYYLPAGHHVWCLRHWALAGHQDERKWLCWLDWWRTAHLQPHGTIQIKGKHQIFNGSFH